MKNNLILLSHILDSDTPSYGNRDSVEILDVSAIKNGDSANSSAWNFSLNHIGTHVDFPKHFYDAGKTLSDYEVGDFIFEYPQIIEVKCDRARLIEIEDLDSEIQPKTDFLVVKTGYESFRGTDKYWNDNPGLSPRFGNKLRTSFKNIRAIGFDFISLTSWKFRPEGKLSHLEFLQNVNGADKFIIIEDMSLNGTNGKKLDKIILAPTMVREANGGICTVYGILKSN